MLVDSHCHLNYADLRLNLRFYLEEMKNNDVAYALCVATKPDDFASIIEIANTNNNIFATIGVHPDENQDVIPTRDELIKFTMNERVIAVGETGLDYHHTAQNMAQHQRDRFAMHIDVAKTSKLPLVIHTRNSFVDTLAIMKENNANEAGAVMHCFTESVECAKKCLDMGFYISISGVVTFKNANTVQEMAKYVPLDMLLVETDAPFLAPVPFRGKVNHPALVMHTAKYIAELKNIPFEVVSTQTSQNFFKLFTKAKI